MKLQFKLQLSWYDPRVTFLNLKKDSHMNSLTNEDATKVWYPKVTFYNTEEMEETEVRSLTIGMLDDIPVILLTMFSVGQEICDNCGKKQFIHCEWDSPLVQ